MVMVRVVVVWFGEGVVVFVYFFGIEVVDECFVGFDQFDGLGM